MPSSITPVRSGAPARTGWSAGLIALALAVLAACSPSRALEAARVLADIAAGSGPSTLKERTPAPSRTPVPGPGTALLGDLYWPGEDAAAVLVLVPGAVEDGKDDPRLVAFANTFARARFAVLVPEIPNLRTQRLSPEDARPIGAAIRYLGRCVAPAARGGSVGVMAISYAAGPALLAALAPANRDLVGYLTAIGGYYDIEAVVTFFTTGYFRDGPEAPWRHREPNAYGKWVFVRANAERLTDPADQAVLTEIAARKLADPDADIADLRPRLDDGGRAVMALLDNRDPERVPALIAGLPAPIRADLRALDLQRRDLSQVPFDLILLHGRDDPIIPATESQALAAAVPGDQASLYVIDRLTHVDLSPGALLDGIGLWRALYLVLSRRDAAPAPEADRCRLPSTVAAPSVPGLSGTR
jgi:pimeloyl-ACP methyl ester carboxylesterase